MTPVIVAAVLVLAVAAGLTVIGVVVAVDRREQREHDEAPPNNRVVGSADQRHNRIFD